MKSINNKFKLTPIALLLLLSGCAVGPDYQPPTVTMEESYLYAEPQVQEQQYWWTQFNDEVLDRLVQDVQQQNIPLKMAAERIKMASNYKTVVESFKVPTINLGVGYYNFQLSKNDSMLGPMMNPLSNSVPVLNSVPQLGNMTIMDNQHDGGFVGASIMWEADLFGRINRKANAAEIRVEQAQIYRGGLTTLITADVVHNYLQLRGAQERMELVKANLVEQDKTLALVEKTVRSGYGSELDLSQAKVMHAVTESLLPQLEIAQQTHKQRLATLLGESISQLDVRLAGSNKLPEMTGVIPIGLPSELLKRRTDILIAEREMAAVNEEWAASVADRYPKFFLTGAPGVSASNFDDLFSSKSFGWAGAVGVSWSVFDGGRGKAMVEFNESRFNNTALAYQQTVDTAISEVDSMFYAYGRSQENQQRIGIAMEASENTVEKAKSLYRAGLIDHLAVLDAQRQHRMMEDRQLAARLQTAQITVGVYKALGGDWQL